jgi:ATP-binding cassette, subfamily F, member 3
MLTIQNLTYRIAGRPLFEEAEAALPPGGRIGLVGRNGTGKTTLFKLIQNEIQPETGNIRLPRQTRIGEVAQEAPGTNVSLIETVLEADAERNDLLKRAETETDAVEIAEIHARLSAISAHSAPARAASILHGLGFDHEQQQQPCADFSGGWRMRVALASVLFQEPDLLLLDEPTNYLDIEGVIWLQDYLKRYPHTVLIISHDRDVLDAVCTHTLHLSERKLTLYSGGYSQFRRQWQENLRLQMKAADKQADERKRLQAFVDRFKAKATKARQAQSRVKRLEKMEPIATNAREATVRIQLPSPEKPLAPPILTMQSVDLGYGGPPVLKRVTLTLSNDDRIGLLGQNGNGKSTLVKAIASRLAATSGTIRTSGKLKVAYFAQHQMDELDADATPVLLVRRKMPDAGEAAIRSRTAQLGFGADKAETRVSSLSGGERARLLLGLSAFDGPDLIILDEPTNHLDIEMREALVEALAEYQGAMILVSHDRFLLEASCDRLWLVGDGQVQPFDGDLDDYATHVLEARRRDRAEQEPARKVENREETMVSAAKPRIQAKELQKIEEQMGRMNELIARVDTLLADPDVYTRDPEKAGRLANDRRALVDNLEQLETRWLELSG